jgi:hypothetical protein
MSTWAVICGKCSTTSPLNFIPASVSVGVQWLDSGCVPDLTRKSCCLTRFHFTILHSSTEIPIPRRPTKFLKSSALSRSSLNLTLSSRDFLSSNPRWSLVRPRASPPEKQRNGERTSITIMGPVELFNLDYHQSWGKKCRPLESKV